MNSQFSINSSFLYKVRSTRLLTVVVKSLLVFGLFSLSFSLVAQDPTTLDLTDERYDVFGHTVVKTDKELGLPPVSILDVERGDMTISLLIDQNIHKNFYSSYYIEKSTDGINFTPLNQEPHFFVGPDANDIDTYGTDADKNLELANARSAVYVDTVADYNTYYYRIIGTNNLGQMSEFSSVVSGKAKKLRMDIKFHLDTLFYDPLSDDVTIHFPIYEDDIKSKLIGYQLYRSVFHDGPFDPVNEELLLSDATSYTDIDPLLSAYYLAVCWDDEGYEYRTNSYLVQLPDNTPPPVPVIIQAEYVENEKVKVIWDEVYAEDLKGYYLYFANGKHGEYNPVNSSAFEDVEIIENFNVGMEIDSIFFKVAAIDNRGNISNSSAPFGVRRPGKYAASSPFIHSVTPYIGGNKGLVLAFSFSSDDDIKYHKLERRTASNAAWMEILKIYPHEQSNFNEGPEQETYIDSTYTRSELMEYRLLVTDLDDLVAGSEVIEAFPINTQPNGYINQFQLLSGSSPAPLPSLPQFQTQIANQLPSSTQVNNSVRLSWVYDKNPRLQGFTIYRGITGGKLIEYRNIPKSDLQQEHIDGDKYRFQFADNSLIGNKRYIYKVMAQHRDGSTSHMSNAISVKID